MTDRNYEDVRSVSVMNVNHVDLSVRFRNWIYFWDVGMSDLQYHSIYDTRFDHVPHLRIVDYNEQYAGGFTLVAHGDPFGKATSPKHWKLTFTSEMLNIYDENRNEIIPSPAFEGNVQAFEQDLVLLTLTQYAYSAGNFRGSMK